jgi:hypothetical protein
MRALAILALFCGACGGFEFDAQISGDLYEDGKPLSSFDVDHTYDSVDDALKAPITVTLSDTYGPHVFDLRTYLSDCLGDDHAKDRQDLMLETAYDGTTLTLVLTHCRIGGIY